MAAEWIDAENDDAALKLARARSSSGSFELWHGSRLVARTSEDLDPRAD